LPTSFAREQGHENLGASSDDHGSYHVLVSEGGAGGYSIEEEEDDIYVSVVCLDSEIKALVILNILRTHTSIYSRSNYFGSWRGSERN
jgi:hypothetical protein